MNKRRIIKKGKSKATNRRAKKAPALAKRKGFRKAKNEKTVITKIKQVLDETAAKLKTILPGETKGNHRQASK
jgi:hypothetical protein